MKSLRRLAAALLMPSSLQLATEYEAARLERIKEEARWRAYDEPACWRKERALNGQRPPRKHVNRIPSIRCFAQAG
jgi:hypothetical protein